MIGVKYYRVNSIRIGMWGRGGGDELLEGMTQNSVIK